MFEDIFGGKSEIDEPTQTQPELNDEWDTELTRGKQPDTWNTGQIKDDIWSVG